MKTLKKGDNLKFSGAYYAPVLFGGDSIAFIKITSGDILLFGDYFVFLENFIYFTYSSSIKNTKNIGWKDRFLVRPVHLALEYFLQIVNKA